MRSSSITLSLIALVSVLAGCRKDSVAATLASTPSLVAPAVAKCKVAQSPRKPMVVEWSSHDRADLESRLKDEGLVAVRYQGCEMEVLHRCRVPGAYRYRGVNVKREGVVIDNEDDLYAKLPIGAFALEAKLRKAKQLSIETVLVGSMMADRGEVAHVQLQGVCEGATHFIAGVQVGAFRFYAGGQGEVGVGAGVGGASVGGKSRATKEMLGEDGDVERCQVASEKDNIPPSGCGALLRLEVVELTSSTPPPPPPAAECPTGSLPQGGRCVATDVYCPGGSHPIAGRCVAGEDISVDCLLDPSTCRKMTRGGSRPPGGSKPSKLSVDELKAGLASAKASAESRCKSKSKGGEKVVVKISVEGSSGKVLSATADGTPLGDCVVVELKKARFKTFSEPQQGVQVSVRF